MNVGKCRAQPRRKLPPKKIDIVAALWQPSETRLAAHRIQEDCRNYKPGQILKVAIKTKIKTEIKQELEKINTRHKYKGKLLWHKPNYIHPDGTLCKHSLREELQLPDLPDVADNPPIGLQVETGPEQAHPNDTSMPQWGIQSETSNRNTFQDVPSTLQSNTKSANSTINAAEETGEQTETVPDTIQKKDHEIDTPNHTNQDCNDGLQVETSDVVDICKVEQPKNNTGIDMHSGLQVETDDSDKKESANEMENGLQVETRDKNITNLKKSQDINDSTLPVETKDKSDDWNNQITEAAFGLMLGQEGNDPLFDKYDNSELLPVGTVRQTDLGENIALTSENTKQQTESDVATADNNNNVNYDSDDTILLEKEITDVIGDGPILRDGLPVETASRDETQEITDQLADLTVKKKSWDHHQV